MKTAKQSEFDLDGEYALDENRRVAKARATAQHVLMAQIFAGQKVCAAQEEIIKNQEEFLALGPYWRGAVTKAQAVAKWEAEHGEAR